jgi:ubiquitin
MVKVKCKNCGASYEIDEEKCRNEEYIMCCLCGEQGINPFYDKD